jgi:hypothetical protein
MCRPGPIHGDLKPANARAEVWAKWSRRPYAVAAMEAPVLFAVMVMIEGYLVHGYSQVSQPVSDLGAFSLYGSYAFLQTLNFVFFGLLLVVFSVGLGIALPRYDRVTNSLALFGVLTFAAGLFGDHPSPYPAYVHDVVSIAAFVLIILVQLFLWDCLRHSTGEEKASWGRYGTYSLVSGILSLVFLLVFVLGVLGSSYTGVSERVFLAFPLVWIGVVGFALYKSGPRRTQVSV